MLVEKKHIKKIIIIRIGKIGDTIVTQFAFRKIREAYPDAIITLIALPKVKELLKYDTYFNNIHYFNKGIGYITTLLYIRNFKADVLFDFDDAPSSTSTLFARFGRAKNKVAFGFDKIKKYLTVPVEFPSKQQHIINRLKLIVEAGGIVVKPVEAKPEITIGQTEYLRVKQHLQNANANSHFLISINISAGHAKRYWPTDKWIALLEAIKKFNKNVCFIILCLPEDADKAHLIGSTIPNDAVIYPAFKDFHSFCNYIALSNLLISPDTSAIHIASAFSVPVVGLYFADEWNFANWQPTNTCFETLRSDQADIDGITVNEVFNAFVKLTNKIAAM